jgi:hypothetical protein
MSILDILVLYFAFGFIVGCSEMIRRYDFFIEHWNSDEVQRDCEDIMFSRETVFYVFRFFTVCMLILLWPFLAVKIIMMFFRRLFVRV